ncbi:hypothetical protein [Flavobacterium turcicum]|uniref:Toxic anion resistance protein TelA n=1 Tax=Flavobacterium turcicum TaxID=2764718 RepID=A0ABR7JED3_9FLAO|nr:hypothetical protein [Flavobacterium turcicum]MBC5862858.1 hypothetical protein [Flavobacterium turcicum]NHL01590.1 hypothetical protein [Flavobacterium turcicum]
MTQTYLLAWLDSVVTLTLDPKKNNLNQITTLQSKVIIEKANQEAQVIQSQLTAKVFSYKKERQIKVLIQNYHSALIILLDNLTITNELAGEENEAVKGVISILISCLDELILFIENRFGKYLSLDSRITVAYHTLSKNKMRQKLDKLKSSFIANIYDEELIGIVFTNLYSFVNPRKNKAVTLRQILYKKELIKELEALTLSVKLEKLHSGLEQLLIYMNFNDRHFINYFTQSIINKINSLESTADKMETLLLHYKEFNQIQIKANASLNPQFHNLKKIVSGWFKQEIIYLKKKQQLLAVPNYDIDKNKLQSVVIDKVRDKVLCKLSTDQTALILRASNELKILISKSMNQVFKTIVPFLSTPNKNDLSFDSMRSKAYVAEERDKEIAIDALERMIKRIKEY